MVGGGPTSNIGSIHRHALALDGKLKLVAGVFSRDVDSNNAFAKQIGLARPYADYSQMANAEANREDGIELVVIATPDQSHFEIAKTFMEKGISVFCEKPLTQNSQDAEELVTLAHRKGVVLALAHVYSGYPMVREAADMVQQGKIGEIRFVDVQHASGWASSKLEDDGNPTVVWRMNPETSSYASVAADLGTHAFHLARFITGDEPTELSAELSTLVPGRRVADNLQANLHFASGARGRLWASMAATGNNHGLVIKVFGSDGALEWAHEDPEHLIHRLPTGEQRIYSQGMPTLSPAASAHSRNGLGHPEGFIEAFANLYSDVADDVLKLRDFKLDFAKRIYPTGHDGLLGTRMVEAVIKSHENSNSWAAI
jgi:predicted dehydrogenase